LLAYSALKKNKKEQTMFKWLYRFWRERPNAETRAAIEASRRGEGERMTLKQFREWINRADGE
jgi:hypothetical protein